MPWSDVPHEVVLCNFGGPEGPDDIEPFLRRLFEDPFIIRTKMPLALRRYLARRISKKRAPKVAHEYASFGYSPINRLTRTVAGQLEGLLRELRPGTRVHVCNRYTAPFADEVVQKLDIASSRIFLLSLYPHLSHSTVVSSFRDFELAFRAKHGDSDVASTRINSWWFAKSYLDFSFGQLRIGLEEALAKAPGQPITVIFSAHGLPKRYYMRGDPYVNETRAHYVELRQRGQHWLRGQGANVNVAWQLSFQSRVGPVEWVRPYTDETIQRLGKERGGLALLVPISFTSDHIETLYEMDVTYRDLALASGFSAYHRVRPANDDPRFAHCLREILQLHGF